MNLRKATELIKKFNAGHAMTESELKNLIKWSENLAEHMKNELQFQKKIKSRNP